ncbi:4-hydroxyphenylpyruvate dioxygenase [Alphaproteobacteria bacterium KMM 3653]|uniref:4-hydroxyphenylpyruvate dioxygenase n=1 Tax=Harenicola maris TaxID=2841044 RepID=A0AAP2CSN6_9RHOB|nr:4-hydroxyphenylpyruvate dioxygenase [Harenicola maris]
MGPFPHDAPKAVIDTLNIAGTDGFEFVEFAHPEAGKLEPLFESMGFTEVARHKTLDISLYRQGGVNYILNRAKGTHAEQFVKDHGPCAPAMAWRVVDAAHALKCAVDYGAKEYTGPNKTIDAPACYGIGDSLLYFIEDYDEGRSPYDTDYEWLGERDPAPEGAGFFYLDHLTHNVMRGNMDTWYKFYATAFNFKEIKFFDIKGKVTGLTSRALTSPCGKIRIPINESADENSQIEEYLREYKGEGIQHIAIASNDIYVGTDQLADNGVEFMPGPPDVYYEMSKKRVKDHEEPLDRMRKHGILIDGEGVVGGGMTRILLQIFSKTVIGPIFFEFIQRKGDDGFGEGNFKALFESIEEDQIRRGVLVE